MTHRRRATTLLEMVIVAGLLGLLMTMVYFVLVRGLDFYRDSNDALEIRQEAMLGMTRLTRELRETSSSVVRISAQGMVFPCPRDAAGNLSPTSDGKLTWQTWLAYYLAPHLGAQSLFRKEEGVTLVPLPVRPPDPDAYGKNPAYFAASASTPKVVSRRVTGFVVTQNAESIEIVITCSVSTRYTHTVELRTKVVPRV